MSILFQVFLSFFSSYFVLFLQYVEYFFVDWYLVDSNDDSHVDSILSCLRHLVEPSMSLDIINFVAFYWVRTQNAL